MTVSSRDNQCSAAVSNFLEHSQNSLSNGEPKVDTGEVNVLFSALDSQYLTAAGEFREVSLPLNHAFQYLRRLSQDPPSQSNLSFHGVHCYINVLQVTVIYCNKASNWILSK